MDDERGLSRCPVTITVQSGYEDGWRFQCDRKVDHWFDGERHYSHDEMRGVDIVCFWTDEESDLPKQIGPRLIVEREPQWYDSTIISGSGTLFPELVDDVFASKPLLWQIGEAVEATDRSLTLEDVRDALEAGLRDVQAPLLRRPSRGVREDET